MGDHRDLEEASRQGRVPAGPVYSAERGESEDAALREHKEDIPMLVKLPG